MPKLQRPTREDRGGWRERERTPEVKAYSSALWRMFVRIFSGRTLTIVMAGAVAWVPIKYFGIAGVGGKASATERRAVIETSFAWAILLLLIAVPFMIHLYRSGYARVTDHDAEG